MPSKKYIDKDYSKEENILSRPQAVKEKCYDCMGFQQAEVRRCPVKTCPLWPWRLGNLSYTLKQSEKEEQKLIKKQQNKQKELEKENKKQNVKIKKQKKR